MKVGLDGIGLWVIYQPFSVASAETFVHKFPEGFSASWIRAIAEQDATATIWFVYEESFDFETLLHVVLEGRIMSTPPSLDDLQGEWRIVSAGQNGGKAPFFLFWFVKLRFIIKKDRYSKFLGANEIERGRIKVTVMQDYSSLDEFIESGDDDGKTHLGIIRWVGNKVEHLQGKVDEERPQSFPYTSSSMVGYSMMKRIS